MPFGAIFGALVLGLLGPWFGLRFLSVPWGPARATGALLVVLGLSLALGLLQRQAWARWLGVLVATLLALLGLKQVQFGGTVFDYLILFAASATVVLLVLPGTGNLRRGLDPEALSTRRPRRVLAGCVVGSLVGLVGVGAWAIVAPPPGLGSDLHPAIGHRVSWSDFAAGLERAKSENKHVFVDFYADWCKPCKQMDRKTFRDPAVVERLSDLVAVRVDTEEEILRGGFRGVDLADEYRIDSYPTVVLLDAEGREISRKSGYLGPRAFLAWLDAAVARAEPLLAESENASP